MKPFSTYLLYNLASPNSSFTFLLDVLAAQTIGEIIVLWELSLFLVVSSLIHRLVQYSDSTRTILIQQGLYHSHNLINKDIRVRGEEKYKWLIRDTCDRANCWCSWLFLDWCIGLSDNFLLVLFSFNKDIEVRGEEKHNWLMWGTEENFILLTVSCQRLSE